VFGKYLVLLITSLLMMACSEERTINDSVILPEDSELCQYPYERNSALWDYLNDWYLWNEDLESSIDLFAYESPQALMEEVKQNTPLDRWSNITDSKKQDDFFSRGEILSFGFEALLDESKSELIIAQVYDDSDAFTIGLQRGDRLLSINNKLIIDAVNDGSLESGEIWGQDATGTAAELKWKTPTNEVLTGHVKKRSVKINTVLHSSVISIGHSNVGYFVFSNFLGPSAQELEQVFEYFTQQNVDQLIIDLRYNGGGSSNIANQLASQIAGENVRDKVFAKYFHNANHSDKNVSEDFNLYGANPALNLGKVTFLTTDNTASASELLINALKPHIGVQLVGTDTHGKPSGFKAAQLCDQTVFAVNVTIRNADDEGDYYDGLPVDCSAADTLAADWGDVRDPLLAEALFLLENGVCSNTGQSIDNSQASFKLIRAGQKTQFL